MSKLTIELIHEKEEDFKLVFLSDFRNDEPEFQFDFLDADGATLIDRQITIRKEEAIVLMKYLEGVLQSRSTCH
jgi:hypothetical protein